ncbi:UTP--GlnB (protein PII) uridylyltransferase, GlnD [Litoreibacter ascidiaceicola]|uniref:Bifunctional uridylyltransferase/uridylyl-removing enzyme n=1 Tax=Litoreibacter ascidiaceicola TaxID=1486859 RepID=A0A1M4ZAG6_9RHOB|nr:[protein-PII] uridylyltransferase [Litoreibacter ascidiaceicola]SHF15004.1 UTP--GlnB (protein PII) uridylyltransferase, GlnD [Litoreibacter ascidiaceicola]
MIPHQNPSASAAFKPGHSEKAPSAPGELICPAYEILDPDALHARLDAALADCSDAKEMRAATVEVLSDAQTAGRETIAEAFRQNPMAARRQCRSYSHLTDGLVRATFYVATKYLHPISNPTESERLAVLAVGGYGRGEMAPFSDVDLLFLTPYKVTPWAESVIESMLYILWDLKLKVGHASRTVKDCLRLGREDFTIRTALLEHRLVDGYAPLAKELDAQLWSKLFNNTGAEFVEAKLEEREERLKKHGGQRYIVEPNVKEGKGGLRDLQSLYWIAKYVNRVKTVDELVKRKVFTQDELDNFRQADRFLWATRSHMHLIANRANEQLTFDVQVDVAQRMGYKDQGGRRAVEHFMQDYFRHATRVGELTRILLTDLEARHVKQEPAIIGFLRNARRKRLKPDYKLRQNRITVANKRNFLKDPRNLLRVFEEALRTGYLIHPDLMRLIAANLDMIRGLEGDKDASRIFLDTLLKHGNPERALRRMNELGVLGAFIPDFQTIVAMMQFNMYHSYTVDEHTIQTISHLAQIEREELIEELPVASGILKRGLNRKVMYVALLLHDIGKGREEDHSVLGAKMARYIAPRLGLNKDECETVEWLVRYHLLMSDLAQKRDIADPRTVRDFAKAVKTVKRLDLLCVLTVCDIRGVGPDVWNNWKASLIRALYRQTKRGLEDGMEALNREERGSEAKKNLRAALPDWDKKDLTREIARHYPPYWQGLHVTAHVDFAKLLHDIPTDEVRIELTPDEDRDATRACFAMADHPGIFARMCGALALVGANVVDARTYTSKDGFATAAFWIQDGDGHPYDMARLPRMKSMIHKTLMGEVLAREALAPRDKMKKRHRPFVVPTSVTFDNEGSEIYTIIEVDTRDRPGLLYDLSRTLSEANIQIASAVIATFGAQVVDTFYVKDMFGLKFHSKSKQAAIERKLREAITRGSERARE